MKKGFTIVFFLCFSITGFGQSKQGTNPFIIKGQIIIEDISEYINGTNKVRIDYTDQYDQTHSDSTLFNEDGVFFLETNNITAPTKINLIFDFDSFTNILAAPGYELTFVKPSRKKHEFTLTGKGSKASNYYKILDSIPGSRYYSIVWWDMNERDFINKINQTLKLRDSVANMVYDQNADQDFYYTYLGQMVHLDNKFEKLKYLYLYAEHKKYDPEKTNSFVRANFDDDFFKNPSNEMYLISPEFRAGISYHRPDSYLINLLLADDPTYSTTNRDKIPVNVLLDKANKVLTDEVKSFVLYKIIEFPIWTFRTIRDLNNYRNQFKAYYSSLSKGSLNALDNSFAEKIKRLAVEEREASKYELENASGFIGKPAPAFSLKTKNDKDYKLEDFRGKVVVLDLWSSWCELCRIENEALKKLSRKFKREKSLAFIGIGVFDTFDDWVKAARKNQSTGIQLFDKDRTVYDAYIDEHIPRFVVIDKMGNIVNFNAPKPSSGDELERLIKKEIQK